MQLAERDPASCITLLESIRTSHDELLAALQQTTDAHALSQLGHKLKGGASILNASALMELGRKLEKHQQEGHDVAQLIAAIQAFLCGFIMVWLLDGTSVNLAFSTQTVWLTLPLATCYMLVLSVASYNLTWHLRTRNRELERIALMDPGLKIPNRRLFERRLESEFLSTRRGDSSGYLLLLDVDHFKVVNDSWGHEAGDFLLAEISTLLRNYVGQQDIPARFGGDELGVIVHQASDESVVELAERLKEKIAQLRLPASAEFRCSVSIGIAPAVSAESISDWLRHADEALYEVKRAGRNGVRLWQTPLARAS